jgi:TRAP-type mannitol/chloroaromatic compound transport system permease small subunit
MVEKFGKLVSLLIIPLIIEIVYCALKGYIFKSTPEWGFEITIFLYGIIFMLGSAYTHMKKGHVAVEVLTLYISPQKHKHLKLFAEVIVCFVALVIMWVSIPSAYRSTIMGERSTLQTPFNPYVWWYRWVIPLSCALIAFQAATNFKALIKAKTADEEFD